MRANVCGKGRSAGFSLVELMVVAGIIAIMAAVMAPPTLNYLRYYRVRGAAQQVASVIQEARLRAISRNVNLGVVFIITGPNTYQWAIEDDLGAAAIRVYPTIDATFLSNREQSSPAYTLPLGVEFVSGTAVPALTNPPNDKALRFNRLGAWCDPVTAATNANCPNEGIVAGATNYIFNSAAGSQITLIDVRRGVRRSVTVAPGGRVRELPGLT